MKWEQRGNRYTARVGRVYLLIVDRSEKHNDEPFWWEWSILDVSLGLGSEDTLEEAKARVEMAVRIFAREILQTWYVSQDL